MTAGCNSPSTSASAPPPPHPAPSGRHPEPLAGDAWAGFVPWTCSAAGLSPFSPSSGLGDATPSGCGAGVAAPPCPGPLDASPAPLEGGPSDGFSTALALSAALGPSWSDCSDSAAGLGDVASALGCCAARSDSVHGCTAQQRTVAPLSVPPAVAKYWPSLEKAEHQMCSPSSACPVMAWQNRRCVSSRMSRWAYPVRTSHARRVRPPLRDRDRVRPAELPLDDRDRSAVGVDDPSAAEPCAALPLGDAAAACVPASLRNSREKNERRAGRGGSALPWPGPPLAPAPSPPAAPPLRPPPASTAASPCGVGDPLAWPARDPADTDSERTRVSARTPTNVLWPR